MIAEMRDLESSPVLIQAVDDPDDKVKVRAVASLMKLKAGQAVPVIRHQILKTNNKALLKISLAALGTLGNPQDISILQPFLSDPDDSVQLNAAVGMALLGNFEGQHILLNGT